MKHPWMLVSDLDDTLLGDSFAWAELATLLDATPEIILVLNSSRPWPSVERTLLGLKPPMPVQASINAMGTEIRIMGELLNQWTARFEAWDRSIVDRIMTRLGFAAHAAEFQTRFKASYSVPTHQGQELARREIEQSGLEALIVCSGAGDFDVLPKLAGKGAATLFIAQHLRISPERLIVAGDSANDLAMFEVAQAGIVVGNARPELKDRLPAGSRVYFAKADRAAGVLEGLKHWAF